MKHQHPVPKAHLTQIGEITVSFAVLEMNIQSLIGSMIIEHQRIGQIITAELSFRNLRALLLSLYIERHGKDSDYEKLKKLMNESGELEATRNNIIHSVWAVGKTKEHITRIKTTAKEKKGLDFKFEDISVQDLIQLSDSIKTCAFNTQNLRIELIEASKAINNSLKKQWGTGI